MLNATVYNCDLEQPMCLPETTHTERNCFLVLNLDLQFFCRWPDRDTKGECYISFRWYKMLFFPLKILIFIIKKCNETLKDCFIWKVSSDIPYMGVKLWKEWKISFTEKFCWSSLWQKWKWTKCINYNWMTLRNAMFNEKSQTQKNNLVLFLHEIPALD